MTKLQMLAAGVCLAMCAAAAEKEPSYRVQVDGTDVPLRADSVCVHGDGAKALLFVEKIRAALAEADITVYGGVEGSADAAAEALARGELAWDPDAHCDHPEHHDGDCGHDHCGEHHCAGHN